jgi:AmiR/NasT family two-component response regulator
MTKPKASARLRFVIAEDDFLVSAEIARLVEALGGEVVATARDGGQALEAIRSLQPDVALLDVQMRPVGGLEAARRIRDECPVPVIMLTAYESPALVEEASEAGAGAYVTKPPDRGELQRAITIARARFADMVALRTLAARLQKALDEVRTLTGLLPMCCFCKRIRTDEGYWQAVDSYICAHTTARVSHGFCPECAAKHYPESTDEPGGGSGGAKR